MLAFPFVNRTVINYCRQLEAEEELSKSSNISAWFLSILVAVVIGVLFTILGLLAACFWRLRTRKYNRGVSGGGRGAVIEGEEQRERLATNEGGESMNEKMENNEQKQYNGLVKRKNKSMLSLPSCHKTSSRTLLTPYSNKPHRAIQCMHSYYSSNMLSCKWVRQNMGTLLKF